MPKPTITLSRALTIAQVREKMREVNTDIPQIAIVMIRKRCTYDTAVQRLTQKVPAAQLRGTGIKNFFGIPLDETLEEVDLIAYMHRWTFTRADVLLTLAVRHDMVDEALNQTRRSHPDPARDLAYIQTIVQQQVPLVQKFNSAQQQ